MQERAFSTIKKLVENILNDKFEGKILDIGSGDGVFVEVCKSRGLEARGIDICHGVDFEKDKLPFENKTFDFISMYSVIEHLHHPSNILLEAHRVLNDDGKLVLITTNFQLDNPLLCGRDFFNDPTHVHPYNRQSIRKLMKMYNFSETFIGLWTVGKSTLVWKLPEGMQFLLGALLPFSGRTKFAPGFLKGKSKSMICVFKKQKEG